MSFTYPVVLDLDGQPCLVIGSSWAAEAKVRALLDANARVTLLSTNLAPALAQLAAEDRVVWVRRDYEAGDLEGYLLVIAATGDRERNALIWAEAESRRTLFNAVDDPPHCRFSFPAIHRQGDLVVAVSTNGKSPAVAARLRDRIARDAGSEYAVFLELLGELRGELAALHAEFEERKRAWHRLIDSGALDLIRQGQPRAARELLRELVEEMHARA